MLHRRLHYFHAAGAYAYVKQLPNGGTVRDIMTLTGQFPYVEAAFGQAVALVRDIASRAGTVNFPVLQVHMTFKPPRRINA